MSAKRTRKQLCRGHVVYVVTFWVESDDRCYADPYGRTSHEKKVVTFVLRKDAEKALRLIKRTRTDEGRRVSRAILEKKTVELLGEVAR